MRLLLLSIVGLLLSSTCSAIIYPVMTSVKITSCSTPDPEHPCGGSVRYQGTRELIDIGIPVISPPASSTEIQAIGIHCQVGDAAAGRPYDFCSFRIFGHAPAVTNCYTKAGSWELTSTSTCNTANEWYYHDGASPGGECVMFGFLTLGESLRTPTGVYNAKVVANSGSQYCIKPTAPSVTCTVSLPAEIDHGVLRPGTTDRKGIMGPANCGPNPVVTILGPSRIELASGIATTVSAVGQGDEITIQSDLTVGQAATPGAYSVAIVVVVSPY
ncbi:hypothetical protein C8E17_1821 [Serratia plymuthica]|uniref:Uncharacterized protein n=1 Tax=Serratia plymuthica TaxID=82996 RepID=A0A2X4V5D6_SERPL|nr:hypothetical protein C8E17_1821 [Serratia plymuthica]CAI2500247.1 Uncharacterised protein [Serratia plymuthica]SQI46353.1 Uncharacterised protein [Serratia plymuthica]